MSRPRPKMGLVIPDEQIQSYKVEADGRFVHGDITIDNSGMKIEEPIKEETHKNELKSVEELDILEKLGEGNSSVVHRAYDKSTGKMIALKRINIYDRARRHQILKELHTLYRSECPFIISFYGAFFKDGAISIALEYMDAGSLSDVLSVMKRIPERELAYFAKQLTAGLAYLRKRHQVHRDIKPSNICFNTKGEAKWSDFGITSQLESSMEGCDSFVGTYPYMSPERIMGSKYSYPSDVWSLGLVLLECAIGRFPYPISSVAIDMMQNVVSGPTPTVPKDAGFSTEFENFIECCLNKDPEKRSTAKDLLSHPWLKLASKISAEDVSKWVKNAVEESKKAQQQRDEQGLFATGTSGTSTSGSGTGTQPFSTNSRLISGGSSVSDLNPFLSSLSLSAPNITPSNSSSSPKSTPES